MVLVSTRLKGNWVKISNGPATVMRMKADCHWDINIILGRCVSKMILSQETCLWYKISTCEDECEFRDCILLFIFWCKVFNPRIYMIVREVPFFNKVFINEIAYVIGENEPFTGKLICC